MFSHILGNEPIKAYLRKAVSQNSLAQTLLFSGPDGVGKSLFAKAIAKTLLGKENAPDLHLYGPEGKSGLYAIDTLREMIDIEHAAPFEGDHKIFILEDVERMQPASANALLKTLEEPTEGTTFILLTSNVKEILSTILSRCTILHFQPLSFEAILSLGYPSQLAKMANGSAGRAFELTEHPEFEEQRKLIFDLLARRPSYPELALKLAQLEEKEEDPVKAAKQVDHLLSSILMWHRDQHIRESGASEDLLFFPEEPRMDPVDLALIERVIEKARMAIGRNMKLSVCLWSCLDSSLAKFS